jgi:hypothetical protein
MPQFGLSEREGFALGRLADGGFHLPAEVRVFPARQMPQVGGQDMAVFGGSLVHGLLHLQQGHGRKLSSLLAKSQNQIGPIRQLFRDSNSPLDAVFLVANAEINFVRFVATVGPRHGSIQRKSEPQLIPATSTAVL